MKNYVRQKPLLLLAALIGLLMFALTACGTNVPITGHTPAPTATENPFTSNPCPNTTVVTMPPPAANVVLKNADSNRTVTVKQGQTIEIDLSDDHAWQFDSSSSTQGPLTMQDPAGYTYPAAKACVWRFVATSAGTGQLNFVGRPLCKKGQLCPMYVLELPFTINVQ